MGSAWLVCINKSQYPRSWASSCWITGEAISLPGIGVSIPSQLGILLLVGLVTTGLNETGSLNTLAVGHPLVGRRGETAGMPVPRPSQYPRSWASPCWITYVSNGVGYYHCLNTLAVGHPLVGVVATSGIKGHVCLNTLAVGHPLVGLYNNGETAGLL